MAFRSSRGLNLESVAHQLGMTRPKLVKTLKEREIFMSNGLPYRKYIQQGLFYVDTRVFRNLADIDKQYTVTLVTGEGLAFLHELLTEAA